MRMWGAYRDAILVYVYSYTMTRGFAQRMHFFRKSIQLYAFHVTRRIDYLARGGATHHWPDYHDP